MDDKISVIMSVYKEKEDELKQSIESILNQTYKNFEFIIVIDFPEEKWREEVIKNYNDSRIKLIINKKNIGLTQSLNVALKEATGKYIARMDADDISIIDRFEKQLNFLKETNYDLCGGYVQCFYNGENQKLVKCPVNPKNVAKILKVKNCIVHPTWFGKKNVFDELNGYRDIFACEDYDFLIRAILNGFKISNVNEVILNYRLSLTSISRENPGRQELTAVYLRNNYKKNKIVSIEEFNAYLESDEYNKNLKSYNNFRKNKDIWERYKNHKFPKYYLYGLMLTLNIKHSIREIYKVLYSKYINTIDRRENK